MAENLSAERHVYVPSYNHMLKAPSQDRVATGISYIACKVRVARKSLGERESIRQKRFGIERDSQEHRRLVCGSED